MSKQLELRVYSLKELAEHYEVGRATLRRWLVPLKPELVKMGYQGGRIFTIKQVAFIFEKLGPPGRKRALANAA